VAIASDLGLRPGHDLERRRGQRQHGRLLERLEQQQWRRARRAMVAWTSYPQAPPLGTGVDLLQAAKGAARPETLPDVRNLPLDPRFVFGFCGPGRVDQAAKMMGEFGIAAVEQRIVQVRMQDPGFEIVQDNPTRNGAKKGERPHMAVQPRRGVHTPHDSDEHVARERQDQDERVQDHRFAGLRIGPLAEPSVIDLCHLA
jgi:hypothetical protein